jgi:phage N-6-adenine-methyltransferase
VSEEEQAETHNNWATPQDLVDLIAHELDWKFTLDPCATPETAKCDEFCTPEDDGLSQSWKGHTVFCNPPYGRELPPWIIKGSEEFDEETKLCFLVTPRTDTTWWHESVPSASHLWFLQGRVPFEDAENPRNSPNAPSCLVLFQPHNGRPHPEVVFWDWRADMRKFRPGSPVLPENRHKKIRLIGKFVATGNLVDPQEAIWEKSKG